MSAFDPWNATKADALEANRWHVENSDVLGPLALFDAAQQVKSARALCESVGGGCEVLRCVRICIANELSLPSWLSREFLRRHELVATAELGSWDSAFGQPWPGGAKRLEASRERLRLRKVIHRHVWRLAFDGAWSVT